MYSDSCILFSYSNISSKASLPSILKKDFFLNSNIIGTFYRALVNIVIPLLIVKINVPIFVETLLYQYKYKT